MRSDLFFPPFNFGAIPEKYSGLKNSRVVIMPVPYDSTTDWHSGTREGPLAILEASQNMELYDLEIDKEIYKIGIHTLRFMEPAMQGPSFMIKRVRQAAAKMVRMDKFVVMLGGEHSLTLGQVEALLPKYPSLSVLQLDAHTDLRESYLGTKYSHACIMKRLWELCPVVQSGIRSLSQEEKDFISREKLNPFFIHRVRPVEKSIGSILASLSDTVYITIDLDVFDTSQMNAVGTPEPGGLYWDDVLNIIKAVAEKKKVVGFDVMELCPCQGTTSSSFLAARLTYKLIGYCFRNMLKKDAV